ncbi:MAG: hypothetical protein U0V48_16635 [Anaerolineales bacterium]
MAFARHCLSCEAERFAHNGVSHGRCLLDDKPSGYTYEGDFKRLAALAGFVDE